MHAPLNHRRRSWLRAGGLLAAALLTGCLGGVSEEGTGIRAEATSVGMVQGLSDTTVTVSGVEYQRLSATLSDGLEQPLAPGDLRLGMWVEVSGSVPVLDTGEPADGEAIADRIRVRSAVRGVVTAVATDGVTIGALATAVALGSNTVREGGADATAVAVGDWVEVHGPLGTAAGSVVATRLERLAVDTAAPPRHELRGRVSQLDTAKGTMLVGRRLVDFRAADVQLRAALTPNQLVRVASSRPPVDSGAWVVDQVRNDAKPPADAAFFYTEGFVEQWAAGPVFQLEDLPVDASAANGRQQVTGNGQRVALFGPREGGVLKARSVALVVPGEPVVFTLVGPISSFTSLASFRVRGVRVDANTAQFLNDLPRTALADNLRVRVTGVMQGRTLLLKTVAAVP